MHKQERK